MQKASVSERLWAGLGSAVTWIVVGAFALTGYNHLFNKPMTADCAYAMAVHPVGLDATLEAGTLDRVMRCRLDKLRYGQKDWPVPDCTERDIAFAQSRPNLVGRLCK
jgi:hypothetical protein